MLPALPLAKLLIIDDEFAQMTALCNTLKDEGYAPTGFTSAIKALAALREQDYDLVLTDLMMPEMDGVAVLKASQEIDPNMVGIVMTGHGTIDTAVQAMKAGALDYILKPFNLSSVLQVLKRALTVRRLRTENIQLRQAVAIHELSAAFAYELSPSTVIEKVADAAYLQSNDGQVSVLSVSEDGCELNMAAIRGKTLGLQLNAHIQITAEIQDWVARSRQEISISNNWTEKCFAFIHPLQAFGYTIAIPMLAGGNFIGVLNFNLVEATRSITLGLVKTLSTLARTAASAMEIALLLDLQRRQNEELERRVKERTEELEAANAELEAFSFSVSHDLRAPLRTVTSYSEALISEFGSQLPSEGQSFLNTVRTTSYKMRLLIDDLLAFSRLSRQPLCKTQVQMSALVEQVLQELQREYSTRSKPNLPVVTVAALPDCKGDQSLLRQVLINLLSNAYKFSERREHPTIEVGAEEQTQEIIYFVRDNGAGFDMQHAAKLFGVFQRLHSSSEFEGTGIGLSIVQRIIQRHKGRIWAEGVVGEGATFYFSLPKTLSSNETGQAVSKD